MYNIRTKQKYNNQQQQLNAQKGKNYEKENNHVHLQ